jgi:pimeloyl-ACP methyl ester carboxylesterase
MTVPAVLLHALAPGSAMWAEQRRALVRSGHRVLTPDQRGYGARPLGSAPPSLGVAADDLARLLDERHIHDIVLAGVSMGGYVAMEFLRRHPGRVRALALLSTRAGPDDGPTAAQRHAFAAAVVDPVAGPRVTRSAAPTLVGATTRAERPTVAGRVRAMVEAVAPATLAWSQRAIAARPGSFDLLRAANVPAVVIAGEEDELVPLPEAHAMATALPDARLVTVPKAGHLVPMEAPDEVTRALAELLQRAGSPRC